MVETKTTILVKFTDDWSGHVLKEQWEAGHEYLMVSGNYEKNGRKADGRILPKKDLVIVNEEDILFDKTFVTNKEVDETKPSILVQHINGSKGFVFYEDWYGDSDKLFVRDSQGWEISDDMKEYTMTMDRHGNTINGFLVERKNLKEYVDEI